MQKIYLQNIRKIDIQNFKILGCVVDSTQSKYLHHIAYDSFCRNYTNICISMDSIWSSNVLKLDTESFYKLIAENKHDHQSQQVKKESNQTTTQIIYRGKLAAQNLSIFYCIFTMETWNNYNALFSQESPTLSQLSHTVSNKIDQHLANSQPLNSLPFLCNMCGMQSLFFRNFSLPKLCKDRGISNGCLVACGQPTNHTTDN